MIKKVEKRKKEIEKGLIEVTQSIQGGKFVKDKQMSL